MNSVLTIGNFDGIHLGHRKLLETVVSLAKPLQIPSVVITFSIHPSFVLNKDSSLQLLTPPSRKEALLRDLGIAQVHSLAFTKELSQTSAYDFLAGYMVPQFHPHTIVMGYDSHFGHKRQGDLDFLKAHASQFGYQCLYVPPQYNGGGVIGSTMIRALLSQGKVEEAAALLGSPYRIYGAVTRGQGMGKGFGFPTANLALEEPHQLIPAAGVYLSRIHLGQDRYFGLTNIGSSPTVKHTGETMVETYILDFAQDIYGAQLELELLQHLRPELRFASVPELISAMQADLIQAKGMIAGMSL